MKYFVTGGAGFIGSALVRRLIADGQEVLCYDKLTYAGSLENLPAAQSQAGFHFQQGDICDDKALAKSVKEFAPDYVLHLAAESHVDRSIDGPADFLNTNVVGTFNVLQAVLACAKEGRCKPRVLHVSTDEVFGTLGATGLFTEDSPYQPRSPYSATKAASDHLANAWFETYGLDLCITNCSNNYGPYQFPEKLIPLTILKAMRGEDIPIYGDGQQIRDWLHVDDHVAGLLVAAHSGTSGRTYNIGASSEKTNLQVVQTILDALAKNHGFDSTALQDQITYVTDRPGHDRRYAIDATRITSELGWKPSHSFESGIELTVDWYVANQDWCKKVAQDYTGQRLGHNSAKRSAG